MSSRCIGLSLAIILLLMFPFAVFAQEDGGKGDAYVDVNQHKIDSILSLITPVTPDSVKKRYYNDIAERSFSADSTFKYAKMSLDLCEESDFATLADNYNYIGWSYYMHDEPTKAMPYYFKAEELYRQTGSLMEVAMMDVVLGDCYGYLDVTDSAFAYYDKALDMFNNLKDTSRLSYTLQMKGRLYGALELYDNAIDCFQQALHYATLSHDTLEQAHCYFLHGEVLVSISDSMKVQETMQILKKAESLFESKYTEDTYYIEGKYNVYSSLAEMYVGMAKSTGLKVYADSCEMYEKKIGDYYLVQGCYSNYVSNRYNYVDCLVFYGKYKDALAELQRLRQYLGDDGSSKDLALFHLHMSRVYKQLGDYKNALENFEKHDSYKFASINDSTLNIIANYKTEEALKVKDAEQKRLYAEHDRMRTLIISLVVGLFLVSLLIFYIVKALDVKHVANVQLSKKNCLLNSQKSEIEAQRDKIAKQRDVITEQWQEVEDVNIQLLSSINYALRIQKAALSTDADVKSIFPESFIYYRPRDIVSGDFYRALRCGKYSAMVIADCTGHGIPGAFLSMLGISALKEFMVKETDAAWPGTVLDRMRNFIKTTLVSSQRGRDIDDGMDMTICCYDYERMELRYAMAGQTAYIIRRGEPIKLKGDIMPVGRYIREREHFQTLSVKIEKGDMVYTFTDGILDQLGGPHKRKFLPRKLLELMTDFYDKPVDEQLITLDRAILDWRGNIMQVDDMTLVGIRV